MPDGITLDYLAVQATCTLDNTGSGKAVLSPGAGQFWLPTIAHVGTASTKSPTASCSLHVGATGITDYTTQVDFTFAGISDSSTIVSGMIVSSGESVTAFFLNGNPGDTGYIRVIGVSSSAAPTIGIEPGFPGAKFTGNESTVTIAGQPINVDVLNTPSVFETNKQLFANQTPVGYGVTLAAGATTTLVPATAGRQYFLHGWDLSLDDTSNAAVTITLQDTNGIQLCNKRFEWNGTPSAAYLPHTSYVGFKGSPVTSGAGIQIKNQGGTTLAVFGTLDYSF